MRTVELRRYRRMLLGGRLPAAYAAAVFMLAGLAAPFLMGGARLTGGQRGLLTYPGSGAGVLLAICAAAGALAAYLRATQLWNQERDRRTLEILLMTRQQPGRVAATTVIMSALLGFAVVALPVAVGLFIGLFSGLDWWQLLLGLALTGACAALGASAGAAVFFLGQDLAPRNAVYAGAAALLAAAAGLWLRMEAVQGGWSRGWEEHPARIAQALHLLTPSPALFGVAAPEWWGGYSAQTLGVLVPAWVMGLLSLLGLAAAAAFLTWLSVRGYLALAEAPDRIDVKPTSPTEESGEEYYWKGFRNPVWTRDIRTRLRSKETAEFIFFTSIAVAAGAFIPLVMTTNDLADPLRTAQSAKQVFFWLTMTLVALAALITPGLTADAITQERSQGTLEMLIGATLRPREILMGKLLGAVCVMLMLISPSLPLFGLCYLFHGASGAQVAQVYLLLFLTLTVSALIGLTQSAINAKAGMSKFWAYACTAVLVAFPGGPFWIAAAIAATDPQVRQGLMSAAGVSVVIGLLWTFVLVLFWGNACEQLEYSEY
jgi:ABC-type transport system involved in multi-copper enzyme maturation permease subunit